MKMALVLVAVLVTLLPAAVRAQLPVSEVIVDNPSVRITVLTFVPGGATGRHQGIEAEIGLVIDGELTVDSPTGRQTLRPGAPYWMPGLTPHDVWNEGAGPARMWDIFFSDLLRRMRGDYDVLITMDRGIECQQNIPALPFGVVLVRAASNRLPHLWPLIPTILDAIAASRPGQLQRVGI